MQFTVIPYGERAQARRLSGQDEAYLVCDNWDDYGFKTSFALVYFDNDGDRHEIGEVKLMRAGMRSGFTPTPRPVLRLIVSQNSYQGNNWQSRSGLGLCAEKRPTSVLCVPENFSPRCRNRTVDRLSHGRAVFSPTLESIFGP